jgi:ATP-binding cassette, subfamily B, bacterial
MWRRFTSGGALYEAGLYFGELFEFIDCNSSAMGGALRRRSNVIPVKSSCSHAIEFRNVSFRYPGSATDVVHQISFTIRPGERMAIVGANGAGKSTIAKLMTRLYDPREGKVLLDDRNIQDYGLTEVRGLMAVLWQDYVCYQFSAFDNIAFGCLHQGTELSRVERAAQQSGCSLFLDNLPKKYSTIFSRDFGDAVDLSGGEWQRIALARALVSQAPILVLDEPTAALDPLADHEFYLSLEKTMRSKTCLVISHRLSTMHLMDRIVVLEHGRVREEGDHAQLMRIEGLYAQMYRLQAGRYRDRAHFRSQDEYQAR